MQITISPGGIGNGANPAQAPSPLPYPFSNGKGFSDEVSTNPPLYELIALLFAGVVTDPLRQGFAVFVFAVLKAVGINRAPT